MLNILAVVSRASTLVLFLGDMNTPGVPRLDPYCHVRQAPKCCTEEIVATQSQGVIDNSSIVHRPYPH